MDVFGNTDVDDKVYEACLRVFSTYFSSDKYEQDAMRTEAYRWYEIFKEVGLIDG